MTVRSFGEEFSIKWLCAHSVTPNIVNLKTKKNTSFFWDIEVNKLSNKTITACVATFVAEIFCDVLIFP